MAYDELSTFKNRTDYRHVKCDICESWYSPDDIAAMLEDQSACCENCAREADSPGRYESCHGDTDALGILLILENADMNGMSDETMASDGYGYCARIGRYLYQVDDRGFHSFEEYQDVVKASHEFMRLYLEGWGASEWDAYISDDRNGYAVSFDGKYIDTYPRYQRARAKIRLLAIETGCYPDAWHCSERGNIEHVSY